MREIGKRNLRSWPVAIAASVLCACGSAPPDRDSIPPESTPVAVKPQSTGERAATIALQQVGQPYRYGGSGPGGFDCSGLVYYSYGRAGMDLPRTTSQLWDKTATVARDELRPGDLLFFSIAGKMQHVGLYLGSDRFVHAPSSGHTVTVASLRSEFYEDAFLRAGRPH